MAVWELLRDKEKWDKASEDEKEPPGRDDGGRSNLPRCRAKRATRKMQKSCSNCWPRKKEKKKNYPEGGVTNHHEVFFMQMRRKGQLAFRRHRNLRVTFLSSSSRWQQAASCRRASTSTLGMATMSLSQFAMASHSSGVLSLGLSTSKSKIYREEKM